MEGNGQVDTIGEKFTVEVGINFKREIFLKFGRDLNTLGMTPAEAEQLGQALILKAAEARFIPDSVINRQKPTLGSER